MPTPTLPRPDARGQVYTLPFGLVCLSTFFLFASFTMIVAELPDYLSSLGGAEYKGLIIALFTLTAGLSRPFSGKLADNIGRIPVIFLGITTAFVCSLLYPMLTTVAGFLWLRLMHGFTTGFAPTGFSAYIADIVPTDKRGEAMGLLGLANNIGSVFGLVVGSWLAVQFNLNVMFYTAAFLAIASAIVLLFISETLVQPQKFRLQLLYVRREEVIEPAVLLPSAFMVMSIYAMGVFLTIAPDYSRHLGIANKGLVFAIYTISSLLIRIWAGRASDTYGRLHMVQYGLLLLCFALLILSLSYDSTSFFVGAFFLGSGLGSIAPAVFAWTIDLATKPYLGRALATLYIALEIGIGSGAITSSLIYNNQIERLHYAFVIAGILALIAWLWVLYLIYVQKKRKR